MDLWLLVFYNLVAVAITFAGVMLERRGRKRLGVALMAVGPLMLLNLFVGGAILFVPFIIALYGTVFGLPALAIWWLWRRRRAHTSTSD